MKSLKRKDPTFKLNKLPQLNSHKFSHGKLMGFTGSIIRRKVVGNPKIYWHYAFIYGFDNNETLWVVENNDNGVECVTWRDFLSTLHYWELVHVETNLDNFKDIMKRAHERSKFHYSSDKNNCEHFVNYCIFQKLESPQVDNTKLGVNAFMLYLEARLINTPDPSVPIILKQFNQLREMLDVKRGVKEMDDIVKKFIDSSPKTKDIKVISSPKVIRKKTGQGTNNNKAPSK